MSEMKFRIGDHVVRKTEEEHDGARIGWEYGDRIFVVRNCSGGFITFENNEGHSWHTKYFRYALPSEILEILPDKFKPKKATTIPEYIEEVPAVRRLKPGWYGYIEITKFNTVGIPAYLSADVSNISELREAIATLSGIADFLEEKK